jgi:pimeloyl-ACP methyl ester carboxylesterase
MSTYLLVHGAWSNAACWQPVTPRLLAAGHRVVAPNLPGHGANAAPLAQQTLGDYVATIVAAVDASPTPVILVGHSMGGAVISRVAELRPDRISRLVYVAAYLLRAGESIQTTADPDSQLPPAFRPAADWSTISLDPALGRDAFLHDVPKALANIAAAAFGAEASAPFGTPMDITDGAFGRVPRAYVTTRLDRVVSPALQDRMLAASPCAPVVSLATGHAPFYAQPDALADALLQMA